MKKKAVKEYYDTAALEEWRRLTKDPFHRLEFETTLHFLKKHLPKRGSMLDAGGGPGRYTIELAKNSYELVLLDISPKLLEMARRRIARAGVKKKVKLIVEGSITDLSQFKDNSFDAVLCLGGPLSHIAGEKNRKNAVAELIRVAKKKAPIFISVMGKLAVMIEYARYWPEEIGTEVFKELWKEGECHIWHGGFYCHFFLPEELKQLFSSRTDVDILECVGLEGLAHNIREINRLARHSPKAWKNWLESHYALCTHPTVFATSQHMLVILKKK